MTDWRHQAACRNHDPDLWFSTIPLDQTTATAICRTCPVIDHCRQFADEHNRINGYPLQGIWAGIRHPKTTNTDNTTTNTDNAGARGRR